MKLVDFIIGWVLSSFFYLLLNIISQIFMCDILKLPARHKSYYTGRNYCNDIKIDGIISIVIFILFTNSSTYFNKKYIYIKYGFLLVSLYYLENLNNIIPRLLNIINDDVNNNYKRYIFPFFRSYDAQIRNRWNELKLYLVITIISIVGINIIYKKL